jgi:putative Holliday junction resolvase
MDLLDSKGVLLGIDVGTSYVGLAVGFLEQKLATPLAIVPTKEAEARILTEIKERSISVVVAGLPLHEDGRESDMSLKVRKFCRRLTKRADIKIVYVDEYGSSLDAVGGLVKRRGGPERIDDRAAAEIVRRYFAGEGIVQ